MTEVEVAVSSEHVTAENKEARSPVISEEAECNGLGVTGRLSLASDKGSGGAGWVPGTSVDPLLGLGTSVGSKAG